MKIEQQKNEKTLRSVVLVKTLEKNSKVKEKLETIALKKGFKSERI